MVRSAAAKVDKGEVLLEAALELFAERGFHGTVVPDVAARAGVGTGTLYRYFDSKEALVNALYQRWKTLLMGALIGQVPPDAEPFEQFSALWRCLCKFAVDNPKAIAFLELHHHAAYLDEESRRIERAGLELLKAFVVRAQHAKAMRAGSPELLMALVYGGFVGLLKASLGGYLELTRHAIDTARDVLWDAVRA